MNNINGNVQAVRCWVFDSLSPLLVQRLILCSNIALMLFALTVIRVWLAPGDFVYAA